MEMLSVKIGSLNSAVSKLELLARSASEAARIATRPALNGSFSAVSGLDQLGNHHGIVLMGGPGSARSVLESYAEQVEWLKNALRASVQALTEQNEAFARSLDRADEGSLGSVSGVVFPPRPVPRYEPFVFPPPVVGPSGSIHQLAAAFGATQVGQAHHAAALWGKMAAGIGSVAAGLAAVAADLRVHNYGDVVDSAIKQVIEVADTGKAFARNAALMVSSTMNLAPAQQQGAQLVSSMQSAINAIPEPQERQAAEAAFLQAFPAAYTPMLLPGVPVVRSLTDPAFTLSLGSIIPTGMGVTPGRGHKHNAAGLRPEGERELRRIIQAAQRVGESGKETFAEVLSRTPVVGELESEAVGTVSAAAGTAEASMSPVSTVPGGSAVSSPAGSAAPSLPQGGSATASPVVMGTPGLGGTGAMGTAGAGRFGESSQVKHGGAYRDSSVPQLKAGDVATMASSWSASTPMGGAIAGRGMMPPLAGTTPSTTMSGVGGAVGSPTGHTGSILPAGMGLGTASLAHAQSAHAQNMAGTPATMSSRAGLGSTPAANGQVTRSQTLMGPMAGAAHGGGGQGSRSKKIKTITSSVEENENLRALLGERPAVVPGVIGHWARG